MKKPYTPPTAAILTMKLIIDILDGAEIPKRDAVLAIAMCGGAICENAPDHLKDEILAARDWAAKDFGRHLEENKG